MIVLATPPEQSESPNQAIAQRALEGFTRSVGQGGRRQGRDRRSWSTSRPGAEENLESTLRFLASVEVGVRRRPGRARRRRRVRRRQGLGEAARRQGRGRHRRVARHRRARSPRRSRATAPRSSAWTSRAQGEDLAEVANEIGGEAVQMDVTDADAPATLVEYLQRAPRRRRHRGPQRRHHEGQDARPHGRRAVGRRAGRQPDEPGALQRRAARGRRRCAPTAGSSPCRR